MDLIPLFKIHYNKSSSNEQFVLTNTELGTRLKVSGNYAHEIEQYYFELCAKYWVVQQIMDSIENAGKRTSMWFLNIFGPSRISYFLHMNNVVSYKKDIYFNFYLSTEMMRWFFRCE